MNRLVLIDGNAILHRAYHALPPLTAPDGSLVNAVYGFTTMLMRIFHELAPSYIAVAFDRPKPTFRKKLFAGYQAKRPKMDEELVGQIEKVHEVVRAFGIPIFEKDGFEADDVIGTLARVAIRDRKKHSIDQVIIVSGDKDLLQLVDDHTYAYMPTKGLSEAKLYMEKDVVARMGVAPVRIPDLKALMGDSSDNYPGVEGIGPKTAVDLLTRYKTLKGIYGNLKKAKGTITGSVIEKLTKGEGSAKLSKDLATIRTNVKLDTTLDMAHITTLDTPQSRKILGDLHFHSLLKRLTGDKSPHRQPTEEVGEKSKSGEQQQLF